MINIRDFKKEDLSHVNSQNIINNIQGPAITVLYKEEILGIFGGFFIAPNVLQVWSLLSNSIYKYPLIFHKTCLKIINSYFSRLRLQRMQMSVMVGSTKGWRWAKALKFDCEGIMRGYGPAGHDCWLFGRIP